MLDRFECYELCVQSPRHIVAFLEALHPGAVVLREDFCGTAAVCRRWISGGRREGVHRRAIATDLDVEVLARARAIAAAEHSETEISFRCEDAIAGDASERAEGADLIFIGNSSIGYIHDRRVLVEYLRRCAARLRAGASGFGGGWLVCDTYGGASAYKLGGFERRHPSRGAEMIRYARSHDWADPLTGMVENSISFRIERDGDVIAELPRAFVYRWRLWSIHELREALAEAGFAGSSVYKDVNIAPGEAPVAVSDPLELGTDWIVMIAAQVG